jgi:hypothetical protein
MRNITRNTGDWPALFVTFSGVAICRTCCEKAERKRTILDLNVFIVHTIIFTVLLASIFDTLSSADVMWLLWFDCDGRIIGISDGLGRDHPRHLVPRSIEGTVMTGENLYLVGHWPQCEMVMRSANC